MIQNKIIIEFETKEYQNNVFQEIADILIKHKIKCDMSVYENINRTEYLNKYSEVLN